MRDYPYGNNADLAGLQAYIEKTQVKVEEAQKRLLISYQRLEAARDYYQEICEFLAVHPDETDHTA